jgi:hypothetical protein
MEIILTIMMYLGGIILCVFLVYILIIEKTKRDKAVKIPKMKLKNFIFLGTALLGIGIIGGLICKFFF